MSRKLMRNSQRNHEGRCKNSISMTQETRIDDSWTSSVAQKLSCRHREKRRLRGGSRVFRAVCSWRHLNKGDGRELRVSAVGFDK